MEPSNGRPSKQAELSRRAFLTAATLAGVGVAGVMSGCAPKAETPTGQSAASSASGALPSTWDKEADVVVLGGGAAGLSAAIQAAQDGASVILLEKASSTGGTSALSAAVIHAADTPQQKEFSNSKNDTTDKFEQWLLACGEGMVDPVLIKDYAAHAKDHIAELVELGASLDHLYAPSPVPYVPQDLMAERIHYFSNPKFSDMSGGAQLTETLREGAQAAGTVIEYDTAAEHLFVDGDKGVVGVSAKQGKATIAVKARKGVVIATSGYDHNEDMCRAFNPQGLWDLSQPQMLASAPTNTGDGIRMGIEIGADLAGFIGSLDMSMPLMSGAMGSEGFPQNVLFVNGNGQRFVAEDSTYGYISRAYFQQETQLQHPCYVIVDSSPTPGMDGTETT
ncbi:MAG: FAD-dependent oxidoreductase, partial [Coriobacteriaceae bacterium]|nr:FAD-dependent oxidoreductase [Coriobacteriaceae bacterium]